MTRRERLQQATQHVDAASIASAVAAAKRGDAEGRLQLCAAMAWAAYSCPDATNAICDNIAAAWLGKGPTPEVPHRTSRSTAGTQLLGGLLGSGGRPR